MMLEEKRAQQAEEDAFDGLGDPNPEDPYMLPFDTAANNQTGNVVAIALNLQFEKLGFFLLH